MTDRRNASVVALTVFLATLVVYGTMLPAGVSVGDEAEAQTVPYILGIAHPTGFPAFTLIGWLFSHALPFGTVAWRMNAFAALCTATSAAGVALLAFALAADDLAAFGAAVAFAFGNLVWYGAINANAQVLAQTFGIYALLASVLFARCGRLRFLLAACTCCGFGLATHPAAMWTVPAVAAACAYRWRRLTPRALAYAAAALALPLLLYAYLPLRSAFVAAHGLDPSGLPPVLGAGSFDWDTNAPRTLGGFLNEVLGRNEGAGGSLRAALDPRAIPAAARWWFSLALHQYRIGMLLLAAAGIAALARIDRRALSILAAGTLGGIAFAYVYRTDTHVNRYAVVSFAVTAALAAASVRLLPGLPGRVIRIAVVLALAVSATLAVAYDRPTTALRPFENGAAIVAEVRRDTPANAIVVAQWNDAAALGYGAFVERALGSRTIVSAWPADYSDRYEAWAASRPVIVFISPLSGLQLPLVRAPLRQMQGTRIPYRLFEVVPAALGGSGGSARRTR